MNEINFYFGNNLKKFREEKNLSQEQFAESCGISRAYYGRIERGEHSISIVLCQKIADFLNIHISDLFIDLPM